MTLPVLRGCGCWGSMSMCGITRTDADEDPHALTGIVDLTRKKEHPTARLSGPGPRKVWHRA